MPSSLHAADTPLAPSAATAESGAGRDSRWSVVSIYALAMGALALIYVPVLISLGSDWLTNPNYSHGIIIPFAVAFFVYLKRERLRALPARPSAWGLALALAAEAEYLVGFLGAEFFLQRTSLLLLLAGAVVYLWGWAHLRAHLFSLTLLLLAIPLPAIIFNAVAFPLQLLASSWAAGLLNLCGIPVFRQGNILELPQRALDVAEACSGIRSLFSLITLAMMVAYFVPVRFWVKLGLVLSAVPIALCTNAARIALSGLLGKYFGEQYSEGFFHAFSGWLIFLVAFLAMLGEASLLGRWVGKRPAVGGGD
ncbi:MAG TPA: exosortase/archaeosortase family protein [Terriglobales bacterium]|nr:exosortase/archaeosortase family protein [Terriglobales bacterium]